MGTSLKTFLAELCVKHKIGMSKNSDLSSHLVIIQVDPGSYRRRVGEVQVPNFWGHENGHPSLRLDCQDSLVGIFHLDLWCSLGFLSLGTVGID